MLSDKQIGSLKKLRRDKKLHSFVENHLASICCKVFTSAIPVKEVQGLAGGRNDLIVFEFNKRKILFEIFASKTQVSRDLRILDNTKADIKIAIVIDKEVDEGVIQQFLKENPENNYPFLFVSELFNSNGIYKLIELVKGDDESKFRRILAEKMSSKKFIDELRSNGISIISEKDKKSKTTTLKAALVTVLIWKLNKLGIKKDYLKYVGKFFSDDKCIEFVLMKIDMGFNLFLFTDFDDNIGVYSDNELLDWIRIGNELEKPYLLFSLNSLFHNVLDNYFKPVKPFTLNKEISFTIGQSQIYETQQGRAVTFSIPKDVDEILLFRPMMIYKEGEEKPKIVSKKEILNKLKII